MHLDILGSSHRTLMLRRSSFLHTRQNYIFSQVGQHCKYTEKYTQMWEHDVLKCKSVMTVLTLQLMSVDNIWLWAHNSGDAFQTVAVIPVIFPIMLRVFAVSHWSWENHEVEERWKASSPNATASKEEQGWGRGGII